MSVIIIRGGNNIRAQDVENTLLSHQNSTDAAASGMADETLGERTIVLVVIWSEPLKN